MDYLKLALRDTGIQDDLSHQGIYLTQADESITLTYHLADDVKAPHTYTKLLELTRGLTPDDIFEIVISGSPGGYLSGARVITTAMDNTEASTRAVVISDIASAATMVALNAEELIMTKGASMMIHTASYGFGGKSGEVAANAAFQTKDIRETLDHFYRPFLTKKEVKKVFQGSDMYLSADECMERFEKVKKKREKAFKKLEIAAIQAQKEILELQLETLNSMLAED